MGLARAPLHRLGRCSSRVPLARVSLNYPASGVQPISVSKVGGCRGSWVRCDCLDVPLSAQALKVLSLLTGHLIATSISKAVVRPKALYHSPSIVTGIVDLVLRFFDVFDRNTTAHHVVSSDGAGGVAFGIGRDTTSCILQLIQAQLLVLGVLGVSHWSRCVA